MPNPQPDIEKMQRDAENRMREMQQRSQRAIHGGDMPPVPNFVQTGRQQNQNQNQSRNNTAPRPNRALNANPQEQKMPTPPNPPSPPKGGLLGRFKGLDILKIFNFKNLHIDSDVLIIIALIFLLSTEETDELLLLALVYIML